MHVLRQCVYCKSNLEREQVLHSTHDGSLCRGVSEGEIQVYFVSEGLVGKGVSTSLMFVTSVRTRKALNVPKMRQKYVLIFTPRK